MHFTEDQGLRERKRAATYRAIEEAAVEIALEYGYQATTAEAIAERANVSSRTFFNYFTTKDQAISGRGIAEIDEARAREALEKHAPDVFKGVAEIIADANAGIDVELMLRRRDLILKNPPLLHQHMLAIDEAERKLATILVDYLQDNPSMRRLDGRVTVEREARLMVTIAGAAMRQGMETWLEEGVSTLHIGQIIADAIELMAEIHGKNP